VIEQSEINTHQRTDMSVNQTEGKVPKAKSVKSDVSDPAS